MEKRPLLVGKKRRLCWLRLDGLSGQGPQCLGCGATVTLTQGEGGGRGNSPVLLSVQAPGVQERTGKCGTCGKRYKPISMGQGWGGVGWGGQGSWERKKNQVKENCGKRHSVIKRNKTVPFAEMWLDLETIKQSEVSQKSKSKYYISTHICGI